MFWSVCVNAPVSSRLNRLPAGCRCTLNALFLASMKACCLWTALLKAKVRLQLSCLLVRLARLPGIDGAWIHTRGEERWDGCGNTGSRKTVKPTQNPTPVSDPSHTLFEATSISQRARGILTLIMHGKWACRRHTDSRADTEGAGRGGLVVAHLYRWTSLWSDRAKGLQLDWRAAGKSHY